MSTTMTAPLPPQRGVASRLAKRALDIVGALAGLLLLSPLFIALVLLIWIRDGFPILYRHRVLGVRGEFEAFKFRTMCVNADAQLRANPALMDEFQKNYKLTHDFRVTKLGRFLRRTSLDELPQLVNVLTGEMSLVGPRFITRQELAMYGDKRDLLLSVKPGMSGYWQSQGRSTLSYRERVDMDIYYIENWSLIWDLEILFRTPRAVLKGTGAW